MSRMISRRSFLKCAGVSALAIGTAGVLGGCSSVSSYFADMIDARELANNYYEFGDGAVLVKLSDYAYMTDDQRTYYGLTDEDEYYVWVEFTVINNTGEALDFYEYTWSESWNYGSLPTVAQLFTPTNSQTKLGATVNKTRLNLFGRYASLYEYMNGRKGGYGYDAFYGTMITGSRVSDIGAVSSSNVLTELPSGTSYINCICGVYEPGYFQTLRFIYSYGEEVNFVLYADSNGNLY